MEPQIEATQLSNTPNYLHLLPEYQQFNELNTTLAYIKKKQRKYNKEYIKSEYIKSLKKVLHFTFKKLQ